MLLTKYYFGHRFSQWLLFVSMQENTQCVVSLDQENGKMLSQDKTLIF
jgi:hypothetical protein